MGAVVGMLWTGGGQVFRNVMSLTTSVILARLLTPDDFGSFAQTVLWNVCTKPVQMRLAGVEVSAKI